MSWYIWWAVAAAVLLTSWVCAGILSQVRYKRERLLTPSKFLFAGTFLSSVLSLLPIYGETFSGPASWIKWGEAVLLSVQHSIRLFALDGDYMDVIESEGLAHAPEMAQTMFSGLGAVLYTLAPLLTFGFILSFFKNISAYRQYILSFWKHTHVFSELNEKTLALAESILEKDKKTRKIKFIPSALVVFTDVLETEDEASLDLIEEAKELGALLFSRDLESIKYRRKRTMRRVTFYLISDDEAEKIRHAEAMMNAYDYEGVTLHLFSNDIRSDLLLTTHSVEHMKITRLNDVQSLIYHDLDEHGLRLFRHARQELDGQKVISAVVVGLGKYGIEMVKALSWFCQLDGYRVKIHAFDRDENAADRFADRCPDLMNPLYNGCNTPGEARYEIHIHSGIDAGSYRFVEEFSKIHDVSFIFICLSSDLINLTTSVKIRSLCEQIRYIDGDRKPDIETVIYDETVCNTMSIVWDQGQTQDSPVGITNFKSQPYNIRMIGMLKHFYSIDTLINSDLIEAGLQVHLRWGEAQDFWKYEYNYRSSIAKALHERLRAKAEIHIPGADKPWDERTPDEKLAIGRIEHIRWNAYMRSEGYRYSGSHDKASRNDLGKLHHNLVPVTELSDEDLRKDA